jgi:hypothetical protein
MTARRGSSLQAQRSFVKFAAAGGVGEDAGRKVALLMVAACSNVLELAGHDVHVGRHKIFVPPGDEE